MINQPRLLARFLRYVQLDTTADESSTTYPSSAGQWELGKMLVQELLAMGVTDAHQDEHALVWGTVPGTVVNNLSSSAAAGVQQIPTIAFNAHLDTSPETTGKNVRPQVLRNYAGGDIILPADSSKVIRVVDNPELSQLIGQTIITTHGTTLLGSDDKSGVAVIMELAQTLLEHREIPCGPVKLLFTCDEEIGQGVKHVDFAKLGATVCYTLDGGGTDEIDTETFSADLATITFEGINIHPSIGKGRMVNALRGAGTFLDRLPRVGMSPETTSGREGFLHPYGLEGGVAQAKLKVLLRDFESQNLAAKAELLQQLAAAVQAEHPGLKIAVEIKKQYRNLAEGLKQEPRAVAYAQEAHRRLGRTARLTVIRGGTEGSHLTERGLPTPNLSTGEHNPHSPLEWTCLEEMATATAVLVHLVQVWARL